MKIIGVIPARYASSRLPGKPLADICGKPMIWWVYRQAKQVLRFDDVFAATDDSRIAECCSQFNIPYVMTNIDCPNHIHRVYEVSTQIEADLYVSVNGDEPLIEPKQIEAVLPDDKPASDEPFFQSVYRDLTDPAEVMDISNVKIVLDSQNWCMYQSRQPIPMPKGNLEFTYKKAIGIECFNAKALEFFANAQMGQLEKIEDIDHLRFLENGIPIIYRRINSQSLSVDTPSDLERVRGIMAELCKPKEEGL